MSASAYRPAPIARDPRAGFLRGTLLRTVERALLALGVAAGAFFLLGALGLFDLPFVLQYLPEGIGPALTSIELTCLSFVIGFGLALPLAVVRAFPPRALDRPPPGRPARSALGVRGRLARWGRWVAYGAASAYVQAIRGTPFLVQVFLVYYAIIFAYPRLYIFGISAPWWAGLLALTINTTGYQAEALRGGFQSVDASQIEAARALGLSRFRIFQRVTFPQGIRLVTLPLTNEWISDFKTSAILEYITVSELFYWSRTDIAYQLARPIEAFVMIAVFYLAINVTVSRVATWLEVHRRIPGLGSPVPEIAARPG